MKQNFTVETWLHDSPQKLPRSSRKLFNLCSILCYANTMSWKSVSQKLKLEFKVSKWYKSTIFFVFMDIYCSDCRHWLYNEKVHCDIGVWKWVMWVFKKLGHYCGMWNTCIIHPSCNLYLLYDLCHALCWNCSEKIEGICRHQS